MNQKEKDKLNKKIYRKMLLIRNCEKKIQEYYHENEMKTPMHMSIGSEHISATICSILGKRAQVYSSYRTHAPFLAQTEDTDQFFYEMYGRKESVLQGRGGSMHLCYPEKGFMYSSAIVASQIPIAVGAAWANKQKDNDKIVCCYFGDGAMEEGVFWESLNLACLKKLPIIFICEDNHLAVNTQKKYRRGFRSELFQDHKWGCYCIRNDNFYEFTEIDRLLHQVHISIRPLFIIAQYHRFCEHVGINITDDSVKYSDPIKEAEKELSIADIIKINAVVNSKIESSITKVRRNTDVFFYSR